jgi:hypothetical protein
MELVFDPTSGDMKLINLPKFLNAYTRYVDGVNGIDTNNGGPASPFKTIQAALTSLGSAASSADIKKPIQVFIQSGVYDESLTIPTGRICTLYAMGTVILGDGTTANFGSSVARSVTFNALSASVFGSDVKPALNIVGMPGADATSTFIMESGVFRISGNLNITGDGLTNSVSLSSVRVDGTVTHTTAALTNWQCYRTLINGAVSTTGNLVLERAYDSRFNALVSVNAYNMLFNCNFAAGMTVQSIQQNLLPNGMFCTNFAGAFTGVANSLRLDEVSNGYFVANSATLAGGATKVVLAQSDAGTTSNRPSGTQKAGYRYFDTTLTKPIWAKGDGTWVDATGASV